MTLKIAIAGGGIGGLAAAALLAPRGYDVSVYDQYTRPKPVGSGLVIQPVGAWVLEQCGALQAAQQLGNPITRMLGREIDHNRVVLDVSYSRPARKGYGLAIHRAALFDALWQAASRAGINVNCAAFIQNSTLESGKRWLHFEDGTRAGPFDLIIDAGGAGSTLSPLQGRELPYGAIWGNVPWPDKTALPTEYLSQRYRKANRMLGVLPIGCLPSEPKPMAAIFWSLPAQSHSTWVNTPLDDWKAEAAAIWPAFAPFLETITTHDQMTMARYTHATLRRPAAEALVHIGDAAHRASPQLGQGANMALLDAFALAHAVVTARGDDTIASALQHYMNARKWHVRIYQAMSWAFTPQYQSDSTLLPWVRDRVLMPVSRLPGVKGILTRLVSGDMILPIAGYPHENGQPIPFSRVKG